MSLFVEVAPKTTQPNMGIVKFDRYRFFCLVTYLCYEDHEYRPKYRYIGAKSVTYLQRFSYHPNLWSQTRIGRQLRGFGAHQVFTMISRPSKLYITYITISYHFITYHIISHHGFTTFCSFRLQTVFAGSKRCSLYSLCI